MRDIRGTFRRGEAVEEVAVVTVKTAVEKVWSVCGLPVEHLPRVSGSAGAAGRGRAAAGRRRRKGRSTAREGSYAPPGPVRRPRGLWQRNPLARRTTAIAACRGRGPTHGPHASAAVLNGTERTAGRTATYTGSTVQ